ncbi:DDE_3 domain-containing protein [Trichonephila clavipes]|nr:DDE_3 domain-containing protein [Trichonephila clavipes]
MMRSFLRSNKIITPKIGSVDAPSSSAIVKHRQYPKSVMVWGRICSSDKTHLDFRKEGVKMNQKVYQWNILEAIILSLAEKHLGKANWTFQQDFTSSQGQKNTREVQGKFSRYDII